MQRTALLTALAFLASGCDASTPQPPAPAATKAVPPAQAAPSAPAAAATPAAVGRKELVESELYDFEYAYPAEAAAIPALKALLDKRLATARSEVEGEAMEEHAEAKKNGWPYRQHSSGATWQVVADLPRWLSLSAEMYSYSGGAHGMSYFDALLWDREQNTARGAADLFTSKAALGAAIREPFCAALDKERAKRRNEPVNRNSGDQFDECIDPSDHAVILGSSNGRTFDRMGVLVEPYAAGAYAEGTFEITLPVTKQVIASVKPEYKNAFSTR